MITSKIIKICTFFVLLCITSVHLSGQTIYLPAQEAMENIVSKVDNIGAKKATEISDMEVNVAVYSKSLYKKIKDGMSVQEASIQTVSAIEAEYSNNAVMMNGVKEEVMSLVTKEN